MVPVSLSASGKSSPAPYGKLKNPVSQQRLDRLWRNLRRDERGEGGTAPPSCDVRQLSRQNTRAHSWARRGKGATSHGPWLSRARRSGGNYRRVIQQLTRHMSQARGLVGNGRGKIHDLTNPQPAFR
jgi:hypothetical protein